MDKEPSKQLTLKALKQDQDLSCGMVAAQVQKNLWSFHGELCPGNPSTKSANDQGLGV